MPVRNAPTTEMTQTFILGSIGLRIESSAAWSSVNWGAEDDKGEPPFFEADVSDTIWTADIIEGEVEEREAERGGPK